MLCDAGGYVQRTGVVSSHVCAAWLTRIIGDRDKWIDRFDGAMFSYGRSWYLDIEHGILHVYHAEAERANALIREALPGLVEALLQSAPLLVGPNGERDLPTRARRENLGPYWCDAGVHIIPEGHSGDWHADYEGLAPYPAMLFDEHTRAYSSVLAVTGEREGLEVFAGDRFLGNVSGETIDATLSQRTPTILPYSPGTLTIIDSFLFHKIPPPTSMRVTAVMHFVFREAPYPHWEYWF
jgi:hypothetical protein